MTVLLDGNIIIMFALKRVLPRAPADAFVGVRHEVA